jgi:exonuclease SbcD
VRPVALRSGRRLRTVRGTLAQVLALVGDAAAPGDGPGEAAPGGSGGEASEAGHDGAAEPPRDHLRIVLDEPARAGLADEVRERVPDAVEVVLASRGDEPGAPPSDPDRLRRTPHDLFAEYLDLHDARDERVVGLFDTLVDESLSEPAAVVAGESVRGSP